MEQMLVPLRGFNLEGFIRRIEDFISESYYGVENPTSMIQIVEYGGNVVPVPDDVPRNPADEIMEGLSVVFPFTSIIDEGPVACADGNSYTSETEMEGDMLPSESLPQNFQDDMEDDFENEIYSEGDEVFNGEYLSYYAFLLCIQDQDLLIRSVQCIPSSFALDAYKAVNVEEMGSFEDAAIAFLESFIAVRS